MDLCLASQPLAGPGLHSAEMFSEEVLLAVPPAHRLARQTRVGIEALAGEPFVTTRPATGSGPSPTGSSPPRHPARDRVRG